LALQALVIYYVGKGSNPARVLVLILLVLALPGLFAVEKLIAARSLLSAGITLSSFLLKATALVLLFTKLSSAWFREKRLASNQLYGVPRQVDGEDDRTF
jgi:hypothetical protein